MDGGGCANETDELEETQGKWEEQREREENFELAKVTAQSFTHLPPVINARMFLSMPHDLRTTQGKFVQLLSKF